MWLGKLTALDMTPLGWLGRKTSTQTKATIWYCLRVIPRVRSAGFSATGQYLQFRFSVRSGISRSRFAVNVFTLRKLAYSNILKILPPKNGNFQIKNSDIFHIFAQNIDCGYSLEPPRRGGSNEYPQSMFLSRNKKNNVYPCKPQFYCIKVGFKGVKII